MKYKITGSDAFGNPVEETIDAPTVTWKQALRTALVSILGIPLSYCLRLTKFRYIKGIK